MGRTLVLCCMVSVKNEAWNVGSGAFTYGSIYRANKQDWKDQSNDKYVYDVPQAATGFTEEWEGEDDASKMFVIPRRNIHKV